MTTPTDPSWSLSAPPVDPTAVPTPPATTPPTADTSSAAPDTTASTPPAPPFSVGQFAVLTRGEGAYERTELVVVTGDEGDADKPNADGVIEHYYTVSPVPQGHPVPGSALSV